MHVRSRKKRFLAECLNVILYLLTLPFRFFYSSKAVTVKDPGSFLITRLDHIGDVILSTPIYHSLKERFPKARITVLCGSWAVDLLLNNPYVDSLIILDCPWWTSIRNDVRFKGDFGSHLCRVIKSIRSSQFDVFLDLRGDIRHIFLFGWLPGIPVRISYSRSGGSFLLTHSYHHEEGHHEIARNYSLLSSYEPFEKYWKTEVYSKIDHCRSLHTKLGEAINFNHDSFVVIFNGGRSKLRQLSNHKIAALCKMLHQDYSLKCLYVGDQNDFCDGEEIRGLLGSHFKGFNNLSGLITFMELKELISRAQLFIGTDSSVSQLSASTDTLSLSLFGPVNPNQSKPLGDNNSSIYHDYLCSPCLQDVCHVTKSQDIAKCMDDISVEEIMEKVRSLLTRPL